MKNLFSFVIFLIITLLGQQLFAGVSDFYDVDIDEEFLPFLTAKKRFMKTPGVKEFNLKNPKRKMIVCVVSVESKGKLAKDIAKMIKVCRRKAQVELLKLEGVEVSAFDKAAEKIVSIDDGKKKKVKSLSLYLSVTEERVNGIVKAMPVIGTWFSKDQTEFYLAVGTIIKK
jgi:hypothetical protein